MLFKKLWLVIKKIKLKPSDEIDFTRKWRDSLMNIRGMSHYNELNESYVINNVEKLEFGMSGDIALPRGLSVNGFLKIKEIMEDSMRCLLVLKHDREKGVINATIVNNKKEFSFLPVKCKEEFILCGYDEFCRPYMLDLTASSPHLLITGASGTGKSFICYMIIANLIYSWDEKLNNFDIVLLQIMKTELSAFKNCAPCKKYGITTDLCEVVRKLEKLEALAKKRAEILGSGKLRTWNEQNPSKYMHPIYICIDELAFFMPGPTEKGIAAEQKKKCIHHMIAIGRAGRSAGVHIICLCQRGTAKNIEPNMKSNFARLTAFQNSYIDSEAIIDCTDATKLLDREVILKAGADMKMLYIPTLKEDCSDLREYVPDMIIPEPKSEDELKDIDAMYGDFELAFNSLDEEEDPFLKSIDSDKYKDIGTIISKAIDGDIDIDFQSINGRNITRISKTQEKEKEKSIQFSDKDQILLNFIDKYGLITAGAANATREIKGKKAGERLSALEKAGYIKSALLSDIEPCHKVKNEKIYFKTMPNNAYHSYLIVYFYGALYKKGFTIDSFEKEKKIYIDDRYITPDAIIKAYKDNKSYTLYYEAEYKHRLSIGDLKLYEEIKDCVLIIATEEESLSSDKIRVVTENYRIDSGMIDGL